MAAAVAVEALGCTMNAHAARPGSKQAVQNAGIPRPSRVLPLLRPMPLVALHAVASSLAAPVKALSPQPPAPEQPATSEASCLQLLKVVELQALLVKAGLPKSGRKADLIERLLRAKQAPPELPQTLPTDPRLRRRRTASSTTAPPPPSPSAPEIPMPLPEAEPCQPPLPPASPHDLQALPPMPVLRRKRHWPLHERALDTEQVKQLLLGNETDLQVAVLGTAVGPPSQGRAPASLALCRGKDAWLFDPADDTQRQLAAVPHVRPSKLFRVLLTSLSGQAALGLPGLLCSLSAARTRGHEKTDIPVHVYGPEGIAEFLATVFRVSHTYLEINILAVEFVTCSVPPDERAPALYNRRARIFRAVLPPDQLNPDGAFNGDLAAFMPTQGRGHRMRIQGGGVLAFDPRAGFKPLPRVPPGDPGRQGLALEHMTWTVDADVSGRVTATALSNALPHRLTLAYIFQEADRAGSLLMDRCTALGIRPGPRYTDLKEGRPAENEAGALVPPELVVTPDRPGRRVVVMGDTGSSLPQPGSAFHQLARGADLLVSGAVDATGSNGQVVSAEALGSMAAQLDASQLLLARFCSAGAEGAGKQGLSKVLELAKRSANAMAAQTGGAAPEVFAAHDFWVHILEKHEGPAPPAQEQQGL